MNRSISTLSEQETIFSRADYLANIWEKTTSEPAEKVFKASFLLAFHKNFTVLKHKSLSWIEGCELTSLHNLSWVKNQN